MSTTNLNLSLNRRKMLFKIMRLVSSKLIRGNYHTGIVEEISPAKLHEQIAVGQGPILLDVRTLQEFNSGFGHIPESLSIPMMEMAFNIENQTKFRASISSLEAELAKILPHQNDEIVTICPGGGFSLIAAEIMSEAGFRDVKSLSGGIDAWFQQGFPTTRSLN